MNTEGTEIKDVAKDPHQVVENLANLFYDQRSKEALEAATRVMGESMNTYQFEAGDFIDLVVFTACQKARGLAGQRGEPTPFRQQVEKDIAAFIDYFKQEVGSSRYIAEYPAPNHTIQ